jgi:hypothetical protein
MAARGACVAVSSISAAGPNPGEGVGLVVRGWINGRISGPEPSGSLGAGPTEIGGEAAGDRGLQRRRRAGELAGGPRIE